MKIVTKPKKWGSSFGIVIPKEIIEKENITPDSEITVNIKKEKPIQEVFGSLKNWKVDSQKIKDKIREEEYEAEKRKWKK